MGDRQEGRFAWIDRLPPPQCVAGQSGPRPRRPPPETRGARCQKSSFSQAKIVTIAREFRGFGFGITSGDSPLVLHDQPAASIGLRDVIDMVQLPDGYEYASGGLMKQGWFCFPQERWLVGARPCPIPPLSGTFSK